MRPILLVAIFCVMVLAACGSSATPAPTATPVPPTQQQQVLGTLPPPQDNPIGTLAATVGIPQAGTMIIPSNQLTPNAPTPQPILLSDLNFTQTGGIANISITVDLHGDGTLIRDGKTSTASPDEVKNIDTMLDNIHFFDLQGIFMGPGAAADAYTYTLTVTSGDKSRTITSQDGMTPPELSAIYDAIRNLNNT